MPKITPDAPEFIASDTPRLGRELKQNARSPRPMPMIELRRNHGVPLLQYDSGLRPLLNAGMPWSHFSVVCRNDMTLTCL